MNSEMPCSTYRTKCPGSYQVKCPGPTYDCDKCKDRGVIRVSSPDRDALYYPCNCEAGKRARTDI